MRIRSVKPEWLEDDRVLALSDAARVLSVALLLLADDHGRGRCGKAAAAQVWPDDPARFDGAIQELEPWFVRRYVVRGQAYFEVLNFAKHQKINRPGGPRFPEPTEGEYLTDVGFSESSVSTHCIFTAGSDPIRSDPKGKDRPDEPARPAPTEELPLKEEQWTEVAFPLRGGKEGFLTQRHVRLLEQIGPDVDLRASMGKLAAHLATLPPSRAKQNANGVFKRARTWVAEDQAWVSKHGRTAAVQKPPADLPEYRPGDCPWGEDDAA